MPAQSVMSAYHKTAGIKILADENWKFKITFIIWCIYIYMVVCLVCFRLILQILYFYCRIYIYIYLFIVMFMYFNVMYVLFS